MNVPSDIPAVDNESKKCNCTEDGLPYCGDPECDIDFCRECGDEYTDPCPRHRPPEVPRHFVLPTVCNCTEDGLPYCGRPDCDIDWCWYCGDEYTEPCPRHEGVAHV